MCSLDLFDPIVQIKMAENETLIKLLELYRNGNAKGERASLFLETKNSNQSFTFTINAGVPVGNGSSEQRRRRKPPSQIKRRECMRKLKE